MSKPFLLLQLRPEDEAAHNEYDAFLRFGKLMPYELERIRIEQCGVPRIDLDQYSGVMVGGGPSNVSDPEYKKSEAQKRFEKGLFGLLDEIVERDFPYLGACYGLGILCAHQGGEVSKDRFGEPVGAVAVSLNDAGEADPIAEGVPRRFNAFTGHKEACQSVPASAVLLASSQACPHQLIRVKRNIYGAQFHPELDNYGLALRIKIYKDAGYFQPHEVDDLIKKSEEERVEIPMILLENFVRLHKKH